MKWTLRTDTPLRQALADLAMAAIAAVDGRRCVAQFLRANPLPARMHVIALGKAASAMTLGAWDALGAAMTRTLVVTKTGHLDSTLASIPNLTQKEAGHPVPNADSLLAGNALLDFIAATPPGDPLVFLLSGGTSSLVEVPARGVDLEILRHANAWMLGSGLPIHAVNTLRKRLSRIKGGGLCQAVGNHPTQVLLISDVPGDRLADIGSGILVSAEQETLPSVPAWLQAVLDGTSAAAPAPCLIPHHIVASLAHAKAAAARRARELGYAVHRSQDFLQGDAAETGMQLGDSLVQGSPGVYVWGGETTVRLPPHPGRGGRNQTLALAAARRLAHHSKVALLALGTDGTDGPGDDAGALVDGNTVSRGQRHGCDPARCLSHADAGTFLAASGDLIQTGPTGTNVMDLVLGIRT